MEYLKGRGHSEDLAVNYEVTNPMKQSPFWEAKSHSASQEIPRLLWNRKVHYRGHERHPTGPHSWPDESSPHPLTLFP
jgi:hypothetical protein